jgi:hypothetical protein
MTVLSRTIGFFMTLAIAVISYGGVLAQRAAPAPLSPITLQQLASPAGKNSSIPQLMVTKDRVAMSWIETGSRPTLRFSERTATGWTPAQSVVSTDGLIVNSADVPSVRFLSDGTLVAHWTEENGPDPEASTLQLSWSKDRGKTWTAPITPHADTSQTQHGFASLFETPSGFGALWIDGRTVDAEQMDLRARTYDQGGKGGAETIVDTRVCECCSTAVASTTNGAIAAFRNRGASEVRDIYVTRLVAGKWTPASAVHADGWSIDACPVNGPAISAAGTDVAVAWFTVQKGQGHSYVAFSRDEGRTFGGPIRIDDATSTGRVEIGLLPDGSAVASWVEFANNVSSFRVRRIGRGGERSAPLSVTTGVGSQHPRLAQAGTELTLAWTENSQGTTTVKTARASLK